MPVLILRNFFSKCCVAVNAVCTKGQILRPHPLARLISLLSPSLSHLIFSFSVGGWFFSCFSHTFCCIYPDLFFVLKQKRVFGFVFPILDKMQIKSTWNKAFDVECDPFRETKPFQEMLREALNKWSFYVQAECKGWPTPTLRSPFRDFLVWAWPTIMIMCSETDFPQ